MDLPHALAGARCGSAACSAALPSCYFVLVALTIHPYATSQPTAAALIHFTADEKLPVFIEGESTELLHYDGGEFYQWLRDCEEGRADPADGCPHPLVVQVGCGSGFSWTGVGWCVVWGAGGEL